ncbi:beta strand repeat-containing protein, partial [Congregibacter sp.]|uniref:beta strand repeat-containing protein n=1 Tax=Congregibacter sp. TaxID=2744308 RepID=UPI00385814D8
MRGREQEGLSSLNGPLWDAFRRLLRVGACLSALLVSSLAWSQNPDFNVTVNTGPVAPNSTTVFPGELTSLRVTLSNNSIVNAITGVSFNGAFQTFGTAGLVIGEGASALTGSCGTGTLTVTPGSSSILVSGVDIPARIDGVAGSGECYVDLSTRAFSTDGASTTLNLEVAAGGVNSDQGVNATGGPQAITVRAVERPTVSKAFSSNNILVLGGNTRTLTITINNPDGNVGLDDVALTDVFPDSGRPDAALTGAVIEPTGTPATGTCVAGGGTVVLTQGAAAQVAISGVSVAAGGSCTVEVEVRARQTDGQYQVTPSNVIQASSFSSLQGVTPANNASASTRVRSPLAVSKSFNPSVLASGTVGQFTVTLSNNSGAALPVTSFTDNPIGTPNSANVTIANAAAIANSCAGGTASVVGSNQGFSVGGFDIPANSSCAITVDYTAVNTNPDTPVTYTNSILQGAVSITGQPGIISQERSATVIVADRLRVLKARTPSNAAPGEAVEYQVTVQNFSSSALSNVSLADTLQNGSSLLTGGAFEPSSACGLNTNGAAQGDTSIDFTITAVPARTGAGSPGECVVSFWVMIDPDATTNTPNVINAGGVCFNPGGGEVCNQGASNTVTTSLRSPVEFEKTFNTVDVLAEAEGVPVRMRLELRNFAAEALSDVVFSDTLPQDGPFQQLRIATPANVSNTCGGTLTATAGSTSVSLNNAAVPAYSGSDPGVCAIEVDVVGPAGSYPNTAEANGNRPNADGSVTALAPLGSAIDDSATVNYSPALQASKNFTPSSTSDGGTSTLEIRFTNVDSTQPITGIAANDVLPAGMVIANPAMAYSNCAGPPVIDAPSGGTTVSLSEAVLAPNASCAILVDVEVSGTSNWVNEIPAGAITADNGILNTSPVSATLLYEPPGVPLISKSINPGTIVPGQSSTLTIDITNGSQDLTGVSLVDWFTEGGIAGAAANGMQIAPAPNASTTCPGGVVTASAGDDNVRLSEANILSGVACSISVQVTSTSVGTITNRIPVGAIESDQGATNSTSFAESTLSTTSEVGVTKLFTPAVVSADEPSRLRIEFFNGNATALTDFSLTDSYPAGLENAADPNPISSCGGLATISFPDTSSVSISNGSISAASGSTAASCFLEVNVVSSTLGTYDNVIPQNSLIVRGVPVPHPPATSTLQVRERIIVNKAFDDLTLDAGDPNGFTTGEAARLPGVSAPLTIRIENPNDIPLTDVRFIDALPDGVTLAIPANVATTCTDGVVTGQANGQTLSLTGASLGAAGDADAICTVTADVFSNVPGVYTNEIPVGDVTSFEGIDNDPGTQSQLVVSEPPTIGKTFEPPVIAPGTSSTLRLTLGNGNDVAATLTSDLVDNLPATPGAMIVATPSNIATDCPGGTGIVTAAAGASTVRIDSGTVIPTGGCVVSIDVTASDAGDYLNSISVGALQTDLGPNDMPTEAPLKLSTLGYIAGKVFLDQQTVPNGVFIPGDSTPITGNTIELRSGGTCSGALLESTTTDAQG